MLKIVAASINFVKNFDTNSKSCLEQSDVKDDEQLSFLDVCNDVRGLMLDIIDDYEKVNMNEIILHYRQCQEMVNFYNFCQFSSNIQGSLKTGHSSSTRLMPCFMKILILSHFKSSII